MLEKYREESERVFTPVAETLDRVGFTPNMLTVLALVFALLAGAALFLSGPAAPRLLVAGSLLVALNALLDGVDGKLARMTGSASARGDYLDHVIDRYADLAILVGLTLSPWVDPVVGIFAIVGTQLTSYMGTQAQAVGVGRNYAGLLGRADRMSLLFLAPLAQFLVLSQAWALPWGLNALEVALGYIAIMGNLTAIQRFFQGWSALGEGAKD